MWWESALTALITVGVTVIAAVWKLSRVELALRDAITEMGKEIDERIERQVRYFGETIAGVRHKITEVELYCRDNFVRKDEIRTDLEKLADRIEKLGDRIESKLNKGGS